MKRIAVLLAISLFASCSTDSQNNTNELTITGYKIDYSSSPGYRYVTIGNLQNGKLYSETHQNTLNGVDQEITTQQIFFYNSDGTVNHYIQKDPIGDRTIYLYYDASQKLIGAKMTMADGQGVLFYRFKHNSDNTVFFEKINTAYDDPNAEVSMRLILHFNTGGEVDTAGIDTNYDGVAEQINSFQYNNGNISNIVFSNGANVNYQYSNIIDNSLYLWDKSVGGKNRRIIAGECYWGNPSTYFMPNLSISKNILLEDANLATFQVLPNNFYEIKTKTDGQSVTTTQYFFD